MNETWKKIKQLHDEFLKEFPIMWRRIGMQHFCEYFGITRQALYMPDPKKFTKTKRIDRKKRSSQKFMKFLLSKNKSNEN